MGRVYLGHSPSGRLVAVKVVRPELAEDPGFRHRFAHEVTSARKVTGFFTAAVVDADPEGSPPWLATAYVSGLALDDAVATHGPWPAESVRTLGAGLAEALEAIHAAGLVHRDLKPSNVLIAPDGPRVVDFGISVAADATALTRTGMIVGTPGFMAPEQLTGAPVTPATDVFALGAVLAYAATGTGPFGIGPAQALNFRVAYENPDLTGLPSPVQNIVARCLVKDPAQRPAVGALIEELALFTPNDGDHSSTAAVPRTVTWLPTAVADALPTTVIAPSSPDPGAATSTSPRAAAAPAPPPAAATAPPPGAARPGAGLPFWLALAVMALAMVLLSQTHRPLTLAAAFNVGTCATALFLSRRAPLVPVPRWPRHLHVLSTALSAGLFTLFFTTQGGLGGLDALGPGVYAYVPGCAVLIYSVFRFPKSPRA
ncbi:hypothetical protein GCM10010140_76180 [Streptosporangium pseudovulgare]|uniref:Protein kinase domain-containing protein n=2 Tax=Streptosporangium pseudovulgare TaxID=35765 RepID=A0ABQ2RNG8_9ACTN|nr:hypothetical protein GCM10010140_76180 [Streptosporangium pseudovulgare]